MLCRYKKYTKAGEKKEKVHHFVIMVYLQDIEPIPALLFGYCLKQTKIIPVVSSVNNRKDKAF